MNLNKNETKDNVKKANNNIIESKEATIKEEKIKETETIPEEIEENTKIERQTMGNKVLDKQTFIKEANTNIKIETKPKRYFLKQNPCNFCNNKFKKTIKINVENVKGKKVELEKINQLGKTISFIPCTPLGCLDLLQQTFKKENKDI